MPTNILIVDDQFESVLLLTRLLAQNGYGVWWARTCREAKAIAATYPIDVLISDIELPDGDGCHLMSELRVIYPRMRGIGYASNAQPAARARLVAAGFKPVLVKPVAIEELHRTIVDAVAASRQMRSAPEHSRPKLTISCMSL